MENQIFNIGDEAIDIITLKRGFVYATGHELYPIGFNGNMYTLDGKTNIDNPRPNILHYRDDVNYSKIDFHNLPERKGSGKWHAEVGEKYFSIGVDPNELVIYVEEHTETNSVADIKRFEINNYFHTRAQAEDIANKMNDYFVALTK